VRDSFAVQDRCRGVLLGLAAGDRNGGPIRMALRLAESLATRHGFDADDVLARYVAWWREGVFDTGPVAAGVLARVAAGEVPAAAVESVHRDRDASPRAATQPTARRRWRWRARWTTRRCAQRPSMKLG
jgi:hypothetical protein